MVDVLRHTVPFKIRISKLQNFENFELEFHNVPQAISFPV